MRITKIPESPAGTVGTTSALASNRHKAVIESIKGGGFFSGDILPKGYSPTPPPLSSMPGYLYYMVTKNMLRTFEGKKIFSEKDLNKGIKQFR